MFRRCTAVAAIVAALSTPWSTAHAQWPIPTSGSLGRYYDGFASPAVGGDLWLRILLALDESAPLQSGRRPKLDSFALPAEIVGAMQPPPVQWTDDTHGGTTASPPCGSFGCAFNSMSGSFKFFNFAPPARLPASVSAADVIGPVPNAERSAAKGSDAPQLSPQQTVSADETTGEPGVSHTDAGEVAGESNTGSLEPADIIMPSACESGCTDFFAPAPIPLAPAPEPSTILLVATGLAGVGITARRFRIRTATSTSPR